MVHLDGEHPIAEIGSSMTLFSSVFKGKLGVTRVLLQLLHCLSRDVVFVVAEDLIQEVSVLEHPLDRAPILFQAHQNTYG